MSPHYALRFMWDNPGTSFIILGAIVLCVTGAEALYADLGHFGKRPIRIAWFSVVMPALTLNYFGQGALLLEQPGGGEEPVLHDGARVGAAAAGGAGHRGHGDRVAGADHRRLQRHAAGDPARLPAAPEHRAHQRARHAGQIYIPFVNWGLFVAIVLAVVMFRSSSNLAAAYGIAVTTDMLITTVLTFFVIRYAWKYPLALCIAATGVFFVVDFAVLRLQPAQAVRRRLVPAADRRRHLHADDDLEGRPAPHGRDAAAPRPSTCAASSSRCSSTRRRASTAPRCS